jgi:hypothetical protein
MPGDGRPQLGHQRNKQRAEVRAQGAGDISPPAPFQLVYFFTKPYRDCVINIMERRRALSKPLHSPWPALPRGLISGLADKVSAGPNLLRHGRGGKEACNARMV